VVGNGINNATTIAELIIRIAKVINRTRFLPKTNGVRLLIEGIPEFTYLVDLGKITGEYTKKYNSF